MHPEKIIDLEGATIHAHFEDGCALEIEIVSTSHVIAGGDVVGKVIRVTCVETNHYHPEIGDFINLR